MRLRVAGPEDAEDVARLHADSWRRYYRGAYADSFLDGDVLRDRRLTWSSRLASPGGGTTILAEDHDGLTGFVHAIFDDDERWGSLIDNLHVVHDRRRTGVGTALLTRAAEAIAQHAAGESFYLWVLRQNTVAQRFYRALGGSCVGEAPVPPPGGVPERLNGSPTGLRIAWSGLAALTTEGE